VASELYAPMSGEVTTVNAALNADPMGDGWFFKVKLKDATELDGLIDEATYQQLIEGLGASNP
jgi:glycine cleavage system H protein